MKSPLCRDCNEYSAMVLLSHRSSLPSGGDFENALNRFLQCCGRGCKREADEISSSRPKRRAGNRCDTGLFEHDAAQLLRTHSCLGNNYPRIERTFRRRATESGNAIQVANELLASLAELTHYARSCAVLIFECLDGCMLAELRNACIAVDRQHL